MSKYIEVNIGDTKTWMNKAKYDFVKAYRHYLEKRAWVYGFKPLTSGQLATFDKEYAEIYPDNHKILNNGDRD